MSPESDPQQQDSEEAREQLDEGLRSCRAVVRNYRLMLSGDFSGLEAANDVDSPDEAGRSDL